SRSVHEDLGGPRPRRRALRRRLCGLCPPARRTRPDRRRHRGQAAESHAQGTRVAAPRGSGTDVEAEVPRRGGQSAHRRCARGAQPDRTEEDGRSEERRVGKEWKRDWSSDVCSSDLAAYVLQRVERDRIAAATEAKRQNLMRKELAWLRRGAPARTSKPKFRVEAANQLIADVPEVRNPIELKKM